MAELKKFSAGDRVRIVGVAPEAVNGETTGTVTKVLVNPEAYHIKGDKLGWLLQILPEHLEPAPLWRCPHCPAIIEVSVPMESYEQQDILKHIASHNPGGINVKVSHSA